MEVFGDGVVRVKGKYAAALLEVQGNLHQLKYQAAYNKYMQVEAIQLS